MSGAPVEAEADAKVSNFIDAIRIHGTARAAAEAVGVNYNVMQQKIRYRPGFMHDYQMAMDFVHSQKLIDSKRECRHGCGQLMRNQSCPTCGGDKELARQAREEDVR